MSNSSKQRKYTLLVNKSNLGGNLRRGCNSATSFVKQSKAEACLDKVVRDTLIKENILVKYIKVPMRNFVDI